MCMASVVASVVPVSATERANHVHVWGPTVTETTSGFYYVDDTCHKQDYQLVQYCQDSKTCGGKKVISKGQNSGGHSWSSADDLGHRGLDQHAFRLRCGVCSGSKDVSIICNYNATGRHNTPW